MSSSQKNQNRNQQQKGNMTSTAAQGTASADQEQQQQGQENQDQAEDQQQQSQDTAAEGQQQQSTDSTSEKPPVAEVKEAVVVKEPVQEKAVEVAAAAPAPQTQQEGFTPVYNVQLDLTNYAEHMDPKKSMVPEEGGKWQYGLYGTIKGVLNSKDQEDFNKAWNTALVFFHQNKDGMFNENFMFRFPEQWPGSANEFTSFRRIIYLMIATANGKTRKSELKHINMELVVEGLNQAQRTKLLNFYEA